MVLLWADEFDAPVFIRFLLRLQRPAFAG